MAKEVSISKSEFAESFLYLKGRPFSLEHYPFLYQIYDTDADSICMKFSRQTSKSSTLANLLIINSATIPYFHSMYVAPTVSQTQNFSNDRVKPVIEGSPLLKDYYINSTLMQNVFTKELLNGSVMFLRYALLNADHLRGFSCDLNIFDECYLPNMELLTDQGWKQFKDLNKEERVATYTNSSASIVYQKPTRYIKKDYNGVAIDFISIDKTKKLSVTENHNVFCPLINSKFIKAKDAEKDFQYRFIDENNSLFYYNKKSYDYKGEVYCVTVPNSTLVIRDRSTEIGTVCGNCQDLRRDVIPVILETMSRSEYKWTLYAGTPKRTQGTLADIWERSTMSEFIVKCEACNHWNILGENNIGKTGVICAKCSAPLKPYTGEWVSSYDPDKPKPAIEGYRVCLLHFAGAPWVNWNKDVIYKYENTKKSLFYNEVLALEFDEGAAPITKPEIQAVCDEDKIMSTSLSALEQSYPCMMGVDYGPINSEASHTVISIVQNRADKFYILYAKKFQGKEADYSFIHREIPRLMKHFNVQYLAADYGMGEASNSEIRSRVGYQRVIAFQHLMTQKEKVRWNPKMPAYTLNRTQVITDFFQMVKKGDIFFPRWEDTKQFAKDLLNVQMEYDVDHNTMKYINIGPDDFLHATLFSILSLQLFYGVKQTA